MEGCGAKNIFKRSVPPYVNKKMLEIGTSTGLVLLMIVLIIIVQIALPAGLRSTGFAMVVLLFIVAMGVVGIRLVDE
ncbi:MAG: hypothetical protein A4E48_01927 [Methanosaeta sp. PtaU1.Bin060]|jgi:hypothetical protein|nr:MAG: hypothetical protein A4E48_01927 [Methanosaeta sp. PtaU1.Bin060]